MMETNSAEIKLFYAVRHQITRYVVLHEDLAQAEATVLTLWVFHTWLWDVADATPYMLVTAPTAEAGKSKIIDVVQHMVREPEIVNDPSPASLFRLIDVRHPTLFIDEVDVLLKSKPLQAVLNAGYRAGGRITRAVRSGEQYEPKRFDVFGPKMFAGIAHKNMPLTGATLSRCIQIPIQRRARWEHVERFRHRVANEESAWIRDELATFARRHREELAAATPIMPDGLSDRQEEVLEPLLAISDVLGLKQEAGRAAQELCGAVDDAPDPGVQLLADLREAWHKIDCDRVHSERLCAARNGLPDRAFAEALTPYEMSQILGRFGIRPEPHPFRLGGRHARGYKRTSFERSFERYLG